MSGGVRLVMVAQRVIAFTPSDAAGPAFSSTLADALAVSLLAVDVWRAVRQSKGWVE
ncbi:MAG: hypothetical protein ABSE48_05485 [Verrucomicrobiota bacterium]|jgi:hypothetical protein